MTRNKVTTILGIALAFACMATPALAQTQAATTNATQPSGGQEQSAAAMAQEASNPFASSWALQLQQNNNWTEMPGGEDRYRVQNNLQFQPLLSLRLTEKQGLIVRPVVTVVNSVPHFDQSGQNARTAGVGDTVLAFALPRSLLGGRLMVGAGPTFIFPTATEDLLSQDNWQVGPDAGAVLLGNHFIAYGFVQQWFKIGGRRPGHQPDERYLQLHVLVRQRVDPGNAADPCGGLEGARRRARDVRDRATGGQDVHMRRPADAVPAAGSALPGSSKRRRSEVEYSAAGDSDDPGPHQEGPLLTRGRLCCVLTRTRVYSDKAKAAATDGNRPICAGSRESQGGSDIAIPTSWMGATWRTRPEERKPTYGG